MMPLTRIVLFREEDGSVPIIDWFDDLPAKVVVKCKLKLERLRALGP